jgi:hypothetical protein
VRKLLLVLAATFGVLWLGVPAHADATSEAVDKLGGTSHVFKADGAPPVDGQKVADAVGDREIRIAIFPAGAGDARTIAVNVASTLGGKRTVGVVVGSHFDASSTAYCNAPVSAAARQAVSDNRPQLQRDGDVTALLEDWVTKVSALPTQSSCGSGNSVAAAPPAENSGGGNGGVILAGVLGAGALGGGAYVVSRRRKKQRELADLRADVVSLYDRLGADVSNIDPKDDTAARQALADASERYTAAGAQLAGADSPARFATARRTALEGLYAARTAREKLGLGLGPDLPPIYQTTGDSLSEPTTVTVKGQEVQGYPQYQPGAPYYYGGGGGYGAGWYSMPFWETLLLTSALTGGFGGGWGGGGFDSGYRDGYQDAQGDANRDQGGDTGGGGGDWGGGGDFGGGGGGDW